MKNLATLSFGVFVLGSSATLAQPYGQPYGAPYGQQYGNGQYGYAPPPGSYACGRDSRTIVNYIIDPATGTPITQADYIARYPSTNTGAWTYDCTTNLWTDHTAQQNPGYYPQAPNYEQDRDRERDRGRDRDRDR